MIAPTFKTKGEGLAYAQGEMAGYAEGKAEGTKEGRREAAVKIEPLLLKLLQQLKKDFPGSANDLDRLIQKLLS